MSNLALNKNVEETITNSHETTNGVITGYSGSSGFGYFNWPGTLTLDLENNYDICCIRFLLWDGLGQSSNQRNPRFYKYRLLCSTDHHSWHVLFDTGANGYNGWQVFFIRPEHNMRYIRIHGLFNIANIDIHIVQIEVYDDEPPDLDAEIVLRRNININETIEELGDGLPLTQRVRDIVTKIQTLVVDNSNILNPAPFNELLSDLQSQVRDIGSIEYSMDSIRRIIINPVNEELKKSRKLSKFSFWGFWVGLIGGILAIISLVINIWNTT